VSDRIKFSYKKLRGRIREVLGNEATFAKALGCAQTTLSLKLNGFNEFTQSEILKAAKILGISNSEIPSYFFAIEV